MGLELIELAALPRVIVEERSEAEPTSVEEDVGGGGGGLRLVEEEAGKDADEEEVDLLGTSGGIFCLSWSQSAVSRATAPGLPNEVVESTSSYGSDSRDAVSASFSDTTAIESEDKDTE